MFDSPASLRRFHEQMLLIRCCEESFVEPIARGEIATPVHLYSGEEAVAVGVSASLRNDDLVFGSHRSHGHFLAKGGSVESLVAEVYCRATGCAGGRGGSMHLVDPAVGFLGAVPIVAGTIPLALGAALAASLRGQGQVAVAFFGDGATGEGNLYESMNFAALRRLPLLLVCENNLYSTHMPIREIRPAVPIAALASAFGIAQARVDGNDVVAVARAAADAVERARGGEGPTLLEALTYRLRGHVGPDDNIQGTHTDIRPPAELEEWRTARDPISRLEARLVADGHASTSELAGVRARIDGRVAAAHAAARASPSPAPEDLTRHVFN
jgi:pyruvate dehydrogenase E1 component alpha subunit